MSSKTKVRHIISSSHELLLIDVDGRVQNILIVSKMIHNAHYQLGLERVTIDA